MFDNIMKQLAPLVEKESLLRIGITGHRRNRLSVTDEAALAQDLQEFFGRLAKTRHGPVELCNGMADGTDLVAARLRPAAWNLHMVLAIPADRWAKQLAAPDHDLSALFKTARRSANTRISTVSVTEPDYVRVAEVLVEQSDLLIAHWDGAPGKSGGTGSVVRLAQARSKPVLHLPFPADGSAHLI